MKIRVHIEKLVIDDMGAGPPRLGDLQAAVQSEIARQLNARGPGFDPQSRTSVRPVDGGVITHGNAPGSETLGRQIGKAVFRSIEK